MYPDVLVHVCVHMDMRVRGYLCIQVYMQGHAGCVRTDVCVCAWMGVHMNMV